MVILKCLLTPSSDRRRVRNESFAARRPYCDRSCGPARQHCHEGLQLISACQVDFDESDIQSRTVVRPGVDELLDEKKRILAGLESLLQQRATEIAENVPEGLPADLHVLYIPQLGFLISMPKDEETGRSLWEGSEDDPWEHMFSNEAEAYYKNDTMKTTDIEPGDIQTQISGKSTTTM